MSGDHDHDDLYAREEVTSGAVDDIDTALDTTYAAIAHLLVVCREMANVISPIQPGTVSRFEERFNKIESLVGKPTPEEQPPNGPMPSWARPDDR